MKRLITTCLAVSMMLVVGVVPASASYVEQVNVYTYSVGEHINWQHTYDHSADPIAAVTLTIVADDVDGPGGSLDGEQDQVWAKDPGNTWHYLGLLNDMGSYTDDWSYYPGPGNPQQPVTSTVFNIDPSWLNGLPIEVRVEASWGVEIETSTLTVIPVPEPATMSLLGIGTLRLLYRKRSKA